MAGTPEQPTAAGGRGPESEAAPQNPQATFAQLQKDQEQGNVPGILEGIRSLNRISFPSPTPDDPNRQIRLTQTPQIDNYLKTVAAPTPGVKEKVIEQFQDAFLNGDSAKETDARHLAEILGISYQTLIGQGAETAQVAPAAQPAAAAATAPATAAATSPATAASQPATPEQREAKETEIKVKIGLVDLLNINPDLLGRHSPLSKAARNDLQAAWDRLQQEHPEQIVDYVKNNHLVVLQNTLLEQTRGSLAKLVHGVREKLTRAEIEEQLINNPLSLLKMDFELTHKINSADAKAVIRSIADSAALLQRVQQELGINPFLGWETGRKMLKSRGYIGQLSEDTTRALVEAMSAINRGQIERHLAANADPKSTLRFVPANLNNLSKDARKALEEAAGKIRFEFVEEPAETAAGTGTETAAGTTTANLAEVANTQIEAATGTLTEKEFHQQLARISAKAHAQIASGLNADVVKNSVIADLKAGLNLSDQAEIDRQAELAMWRAQLKTPATEGTGEWVVLNLPRGVTEEQKTGQRSDYHGKRARVVQVSPQAIIVWSPDTGRQLQVTYSDVLRDGTVVQTAAAGPAPQEGVAGGISPEAQRGKQYIDYLKGKGLTREEAETLTTILLGLEKSIAGIEKLEIPDEEKETMLAPIRARYEKTQADLAEKLEGATQASEQAGGTDLRSMREKTLRKTLEKYYTKEQIDNYIQTHPEDLDKVEEEEPTANGTAAEPGTQGPAERTGAASAGAPNAAQTPEVTGAAEPDEAELAEIIRIRRQRGDTPEQIQAYIDSLSPTAFLQKSLKQLPGPTVSTGPTEATNQVLPEELQQQIEQWRTAGLPEESINRHIRAALARLQRANASAAEVVERQEPPEETKPVSTTEEKATAAERQAEKDTIAAAEEELLQNHGVNSLEAVTQFDATQGKPKEQET